ncbi:hypothetical protein BD309DRAFT_518605 [Dichomitus squalens]|uniref:Uncharacterized protein n=1 Tax=Dichomitus squalens TaxID=114155 RepID=A0A4Q9P027_9APHY|nr:hypothetical protein BD309DRAFT_518605 [Dichomitus squalens]TBU63180.1 hypothetical protein BD310DRAFT_620713 [Dichomitus squalens]
MILRMAYRSCCSASLHHCVPLTLLLSYFSVPSSMVYVSRIHGSSTFDVFDLFQFLRPNYSATLNAVVVRSSYCS